MKDCPDCQIREVADRLLGEQLRPVSFEVAVYEDNGSTYRLKPTRYIGWSTVNNRLVVAIDK